MSIVIEALFWASAAVVFYTYIGYGLVLGLMIAAKKLMFMKHRSFYKRPLELPDVTLLVPAFNEEGCIDDKVSNCMAQDYPSEHMNIVFVTDGSTDQTVEKLSKHSGIKVLHADARSGKMAAVNRAMEHISTPIVVLTDANTRLNRQAVSKMVRHFEDPEVACVAGEKRVRSADMHDVKGEGLYWKYESLLKRWDAMLYSVVGAAGELFAIRRSQFKPVPTDTILDDFVLSLSMAGQGYKTAYEPGAYAMEKPSANVLEEMKRKVRICAGGFQAMMRLSGLLNPFRHGLLSFQYISHRVMRWTIAPLALLFLFLSNLALAVSGPWIYAVAFFIQVCFYASAAAGWLYATHRIDIKINSLPMYFTMMNASVFAGFIRFVRNSQPVTWERVERA